jgi:para-nitrobenzyl esterase
MRRNETCAVADARRERRSGGSKRGFLVVCLAVAGAVHLLTPGTPTQGASCLVTTPSGNVQGLDNGSSCTVLGIPFAAPPVGDLRWKPPQTAAA